jgi:hypothetical protein
VDFAAWDPFAERQHSFAEEARRDLAEIRALAGRLAEQDRRLILKALRQMEESRELMEAAHRTQREDAARYLLPHWVALRPDPR